MKIICPYCNRDTNFIEGDRLPKFCFHCRKLLPDNYCKKCGHGILPDDAKYCMYCGAKVRTVAEMKKDLKDETPTV